MRSHMNHPSSFLPVNYTPHKPQWALDWLSPKMVYSPHVSNVKTTMFCHYHFFSSIINKIVIWCWYCFEFDMYQFFFATFGWHFSISQLRFINPVTSTPGTQKPGITTLLIYPAVLTNSCYYNRQLYDKNIFICESKGVLYWNVYFPLFS